ncbi:cytochrome P450 [Clohesyomyces aquaticus]|uniref:Cytochrome P450 n=1 Tax=Clohesyomyces aquaticus TaxID=1231657 RepID=A0A1Y1Z2Q1_9PLEO|nr:cytochrome P450 [Clohesyomyces aquaticus]
MGSSSLLQDVGYPVLISGLLFLSSLYVAGLAIYRVYFHPLSHIPGPRLTAATHWFGFYWDVFPCTGEYMNQFERYHAKYGPIIRIGPDELHCNDPGFIDQIYAGSGSGKKRDKSSFYLNGVQLHKSCFGSAPHDLHRSRRAVLNPFFSKASVTRIEPMIQSFCEKINTHIESYAGTNEPCNVTHAFVCLTTDIISQYAFGFHHNYTGTRSFTPNLSPAFVAGEGTIHLFQHIPFLLPLFEAGPEWVAKIAAPGTEEYLKYQREIYRTVDDVFTEKIDTKDTKKQKTIFGEVLNAKNVPEEEKSVERLKGSAREVIGAGTVTTANALSYAVYYILATSGVMTKLHTEILTAFPSLSSPPSLALLESLPYLSAVLHETLRFSTVCTRLPRVAHETLHYRSTFQGKHYDIAIPPRTAIGMSAQLVHSNPEIFPEPERFWPERWLDGEGKRHKELEPYFLAFSKGGRQCLGINLAWGELHIALAMFVRRFGTRIELFETGPGEVTYKYDLFEPGTETYNGVRILVN